MEQRSCPDRHQVHLFAYPHRFCEFNRISLDPANMSVSITVFRIHCVGKRFNGLEIELVQFSDVFTSLLVLLDVKDVELIDDYS